MCRIMEEFGKEERKEAVKERNIQVAIKLLKQGKLSETEISELLGLSEKQMKDIKEKVLITA